MTYLEEIMNVLTDEPIEYTEMLEKADIDRTKDTYVIQALKKGIKLNIINMIKTPNIKTKFTGHHYCLKK